MKWNTQVLYILYNFYGSPMSLKFKTRNSKFLQPTNQFNEPTTPSSQLFRTTANCFVVNCGSVNIYLDCFIL
jgi:hypothetical protein